MPTYDYVCRACGHEFELFQSMTDSVKRKCPKCAKAKLERLIGTGAGVIFKGSGFYQTDYRSEGYKKAADAEKKPAGESGGKESKDSKPGSCACGEGTCAAKPADSAKGSKNGKAK
ncbi:MAG: zinc ribbon domain-containing protein [Phycisphaerales bacterium]|nr:zinc ribbon domain-containing protein [Phycisphaerales bacterium]